MAERIRVLVATIKFAGGGAERVIGTFLKHVDRSRFEPGLVIFRDERTYDIPADVPVWVVKKTRPWHIPRVILQISRIIQEWRPDVLYSHLALANLCAGLAVKIAGRPVCWTPVQHLNPGDEIPFWWRTVFGRILNTASTVIAVSRGVGADLPQSYRLPASRIRVIYNPVDFDAIDRVLMIPPLPRPPRPTIINLARLAPEKDQETLLRAFCRVRQAVDADLVIVGEGHSRTDLEELAAKLGLREYVSMPGWDTQPFARLRQSDVFVLSSKAGEALPTALIEAMACGVPSVSTRCRFGPDEIIEDGLSGLLVPICDADALAQAIIRVLQNPSWAADIAQKGCQRVRALFSARQQVPEVEGLFVRLLASRISESRAVSGKPVKENVP